MPIITPDQGTVSLGGSRITPAETYVRQPIDETGSGIEKLARAIGGLGNALDENKYNQDLQNADVYTEQLRKALNGRQPTDEDINNVLSDVHPAVRARISESLGYLDAQTKGSDYFKDIPFTMAPEESAKAYDGIYGKAAQDSASGNLSYQSGYLKAIREQVLLRSKNDNETRIKAAKDVVGESFSRETSATLTDTYRTFQTITAGSASQQDAVKRVADNLGIAPTDLAAIIWYETGGTMSPAQSGGVNKDGTGAGSFLGLIQFSPENQARYGVHKGQTFEEQMAAVGAYLKDRGVKPGMGLLDLYSTVNAGSPGRYDAKDANGTVREHASRISGSATLAANKFMGGTYSADPNQVGISGQPVGPLQMALRAKWEALDTEYQKTMSVEKGELRDRIANEILLLGLQEHDPAILDAIPASKLPTEMKKTFLAARNQILTYNAEADSRAAAALERKRKEDSRLAEQKLNEIIISGRNELTAQERLDLNKVNPDLVEKFNERVKNMNSPYINDREEAVKLSEFQKEVDKVSAAGGDIDSVSFDHILGKEQFKAASEYAAKMKKEGGEYNNKYYDEAWKRSRQSIYQYVYGGTVDAAKGNPAMELVEWTFQENLRHEVSQFLKDNKRLPNGDAERFQLYKKVLQNTMTDAPPETFKGMKEEEGMKLLREGKTALPQEAPFKKNPDGSIVGPNNTKGRFLKKPDGTQVWISE